MSNFLHPSTVDECEPVLCENEADCLTPQPEDTISCELTNAFNLHWWLVNYAKEEEKKKLQTVCLFTVSSLFLHPSVLSASDWEGAVAAGERRLSCEHVGRVNNVTNITHIQWIVSKNVSHSFRAVVSMKHCLRLRASPFTNVSVRLSLNQVCVWTILPIIHHQQVLI